MTECMVIGLGVFVCLMLIPIIAFIILFKEDKKNISEIKGAKLVKR